jgi:hypothetical protein
MTTIEPSIVRIRAPDGGTVGAGFLVAEGQVLTCAHVVAAALGLPEDTPETPQAVVYLDFPLVAPGRILTARVTHWQPGSDVAGLELDGDPPAAARPVRLVTAKDLWAHAFRAFGFPTGCDDGVWASGLLRGRQAAGWVQIEDVKEPGYWVQPGFSGTAVWDEQLNGVVGMAVAADTDRGIKAAFMIPANLLIEAWPKLAEQSLDAGSLEYLREQLAMLEAAQQEATDPRRFQPRIDELQAAIAGWDGRKEPPQHGPRYQISITDAQGVVIGDGAQVTQVFGGEPRPSAPAQAVPASRGQRCADLAESIGETLELIKQYEDQRRLADDPKVKRRAEREIADLRSQLAAYQAEYRELGCE